MAAEDLARDNRNAAAKAKTRVDDLNNKALTAGKILVMEQVVNGLPAPVNFAAKALGEGLFAAFKVAPDAVLQPASPAQDPVKLMAYAMAFAIMKAIWCFIKSLLNPMPFIGIFFPLCSNDSQLTEGNDQATIAARIDAALDNDNKALNRASNDFASKAGTGQAVVNNVDELNKAVNDLANSQNALAGVQSTIMTDGDVGITFEQFVARTASNVSNPNITGAGVVDALRSQTSQNTNTSANVQPQIVQEPEWQPTDKLNAEPLSYQEYRKLFGL